MSRLNICTYISNFYLYIPLPPPPSFSFHPSTVTHPHTIFGISAAFALARAAGSDDYAFYENLSKSDEEIYDSFDFEDWQFEEPTYAARDGVEAFNKLCADYYCEDEEQHLLWKTPCCKGIKSACSGVRHILDQGGDLAVQIKEFHSKSLVLKKEKAAHLATQAVGRLPDSFVERSATTSSRRQARTVVKSASEKIQDHAVHVCASLPDVLCVRALAQILEVDHGYLYHVHKDGTSILGRAGRTINVSAVPSCAVLCCAVPCLAGEQLCVAML